MLKSSERKETVKVLITWTVFEKEKTVEFELKK